MKLDGIGLFVKDMATMIRFYRDVLGFAITEPEDAVNVYLVKDGTLFMLYPREKFEEFASQTFGYAKEINGHFEIALAVENFAAVDRTYAEITAKGAVGVVAPVTCPWGQRTCYIADPEGNLIEIGSFNKE